MAEKSTIARPYARALFRLALAQKKAAAWSPLLAVAAAVAHDERVTKLLGHPRVTAAQLVELVLGVVESAVGKDAVEEQLRNFIRTLAANRRLAYLPEIAAIFEHLRAESENIADVDVTSAVALDANQQQKYAAALRQRLQREVRLHYRVDPALLGGAILKADDLVIDGSLRGRLERLGAAVTG